MKVQSDYAQHGMVQSSPQSMAFFMPSHPAFFLAAADLSHPALAAADLSQSGFAAPPVGQSAGLAEAPFLGQSGFSHLLGSQLAMSSHCAGLQSLPSAQISPERVWVLSQPIMTHERRAAPRIALSELFIFVNLQIESLGC